MGLELDECIEIGGIDTAGWTEAERNELRALLAQEQAARRDEDAVAAEKVKPSFVIAQKRKDAERAKRDAEDARALADAEVEHGADNIGTLRTKMGLVVMVAPSKAEDKRITKAHAENKRTMGEQEADFVWLREMIGLCAYPSEDRIKEMVDTIPRFEDSLTNMYGGLVHGLDERMLGK